MQHEQLVAMLKYEGFEVHQCTIILGSTGGIFNSSIESLEVLGIEGSRISKLIKRLHNLSINWLHTIVQKRRLLEATATLPHQTRQKKPPDR